MSRKIHILAKDHRLSSHNPDGGAISNLRHNGLAYRTALCGQVNYTKFDGTGRWVTQFGTLRAVDADTTGATCATCLRLAKNG